MAQITMPKLSDTMEEGKVARWLKHEGDSITEGEPIAEIETDKANVEMEAYEPGVLSHIIAKEGEMIPVGEPIAELEAPETASASQAPPEKTSAETPYTPSTKAPEPYSTDQVPQVTTPPPQEAAETVPKTEEKPSEEKEAPEEERIIASPLARRMAEENNIDLSEVSGTGPNGRIVEADIESYLSQTKKAQAPQPEPRKEEKPRPAPTPAPAMEIPSEEVEPSRMRKTIAERMSKSKQTIPHFYLTTEIEMDWASRVRDELNDGSEIKISFNDLVIKACALALNMHQEVNASYLDGKLILYKAVNIGIAVALDEGLMVPVLRDADKKPIRQIAEETKELIKRTRENKLSISDYTGAVFTLSNLGMFDVENFISIINPPESASLAIGTIKEIPVVVDDQITVSKRMKATLSADHRVLDGAVAARFMQDVKRRLEAPITLLQCA